MASHHMAFFQLTILFWGQIIDKMQALKGRDPGYLPLPQDKTHRGCGGVSRSKLLHWWLLWCATACYGFSCFHKMQPLWPSPRTTVKLSVKIHMPIWLAWSNGLKMAQGLILNFLKTEFHSFLPLWQTEACLQCCISSSTYTLHGISNCFFKLPVILSKDSQIKTGNWPLIIENPHPDRVFSLEAAFWAGSHEYKQLWPRQQKKGNIWKW